MDERTRRRDPEQDLPAAFPGAGAAPGGLDDLRARADALDRATDAAIAKAMSGNSQKFLGSVRQEGGQ